MIWYDDDVDTLHRDPSNRARQADPSGTLKDFMRTGWNPPLIRYNNGIGGIQKDRIENSIHFQFMSVKVECTDNELCNYDLI